MAGSTSFDLVKKVLKALPSLLAENTFCQLYSLYRSGKYFTKFSKCAAFIISDSSVRDPKIILFVNI